jgi:glycosyltransferase involved in cell wall biosynthesis
MNNKPIYVLIPAYNEENSIGNVIEGLKKLDMDLEIIVVDDGSKDSTRDVAMKAGALVVRHAVNLGQWAALRTAFMISLLDNAEIVITMDADGQHCPENLLTIATPVLKGEADLVIGSRFLDANKPDMQIHRYYGIKFFNVLLAFITGLKLSDCTCGYKAYRGKILYSLLPLLKENQYGALESLILASRRRARICERPIISIRSNRTTKGRLRYAFTLFRTILKTIIKY